MIKRQNFNPARLTVIPAIKGEEDDWRSMNAVIRMHGKEMLQECIVASFSK
jgi:hypothetical protein